MRSLIVAAVLLAACGTRADSTGAVASASASPSPTPSLTATPTATPSPTLRPNPTAGPGAYTNLAAAYRVGLPAGWRRSACQSTRGDGVPRVETFTSATVTEESGTDTGSAQDIVLVRVEDNAAGKTALQWLEAGNMGFSMGSRFERTTFDGKDAARIVAVDTGKAFAYVVPARARMYALSRGLREPTPASEASATALMTSLHVLTDVELAAARATLASPSPAPARAVEAVADALARGFSQKDTSLIAPVADECFQSALENAGGSFRAMSVALADIQKGFANGLVVTVQARPIVDQMPSSANVLGTWKDPGQPQRNVKFMLQKVGDTWYWVGLLYLQPTR